MSDVQRVAKNTFALFIAQIVSTVLSIVLSVFLARDLGDVIFGKYSFAIALALFFSVFSDVGYRTLLVREVARDRTKASIYLSNIFCFHVILSLIIFVFLVITINLMNYPTDTKGFVYLFGLYTLLEALSSTFKVTFRAFQHMEFEAGITIFSNIIRVASGIVVLFLGYGLLEIAFVFIFSGIVDLFLSFFMCERRFVKTQMQFNTTFFKNSIKIALPLWAVSLFGTIYTRTGTIMLSAMKGDAVVGWYNAAYSLVLGLGPIPLLFIGSLQPTISYYYMYSRESLKITYEKSFNYLFILGLPIAVGTTMTANKIIFFFYGQAYANSIVILQILAWNILILFLYTILGGFLISIDKQNQMALSVVLTALLNVVLNVLLIPYLSYVGSALATLFAVTFLLVTYLFFLSKYLHRLPYKKIIMKPALAVSVMGIFIYFFSFLNLFLLIGVGAVLYFITLFLIRGFTKEDITLFRQILIKKM
jgi:O-antigen/teichoic acid export membrane protein